MDKIEAVKFTRRCLVQDSSQITQIWYDPKGKDMLVKFSGGEEPYVYHKVSPAMFGGLISDPDSVGKTFHSQFRTNKAIKFTKLEKD